MPSGGRRDIREASATRPGPRLFAMPGENFEFVVKLRGIMLGRVRTAIGEPGLHAGHRAIIMRSRGDATGVLAIFGKLAYELTTMLDVERGGTLVNREESWLEIAGREEHERDDLVPEGDFPLPYDAHAAMAHMRAWQTAPGEEDHVFLRVADMDFTLKLRHSGVEWMAHAKVHAIRYHGIVETISDHYPFTIWISDDPSRVPVKLVTGSEWGTISAELEAYDQLPSL